MGPMPLSRAARVAALVATCGLSAPLVARAFPPKRPPSRPAAAAAPVVPVQIAGLAAGDGRTFASVMHAIRRDALPGLLACHAQLQPRGMVRVALEPRADGRWTVAGVSSARRDRALEACVRRAVARVAVPPSEGPEDPPVAFSVAFGMRAFGR